MRQVVRTRNRGLPWTPQSNETLLAMVERGLGDAQIGSRLGRSAKAIQQQRWKLFARGLRPDGLTMDEAARAIGVTRASISRYIRGGLLEAHRIGVRAAGPSGLRAAEWRIQPEALRAFFAESTSWGRWSPDRITDEYWREVAAASVPARLVSTAEAARRLHYTHRHVKWLIDKGRLPAVRCTGPAGGVVVRIPESALLERAA